MSLSRSLLDFAALLLRFRRRIPAHPHAPTARILVIRRNRMGDMIYTLPLLHALRRHFPQAHIAVTCDPLGAPIAQACPSVDDVMLLNRGFFGLLRNARGLQDYDWVIAAKGGFDRRLARLVRLTNAPVRIGFERAREGESVYYTNPVLPPDESPGEHQIETLLRLLEPLGLLHRTALGVDLSLRVPEASRQFAANILAKPPFSAARTYMLINFSSTTKLKFREEDFITLIRKILGATELAIGLVASPIDQQKSLEIAMCMASKRILAIDTPGVMDLAALMEKAMVLLTPEGGAAHLAAAMNTPALVLWSEGPFEKWHSRGRRHAYVLAQPDEKFIPIDRVWEALKPYLHAKFDDVEQAWIEAMSPDENPPQ